MLQTRKASIRQRRLLYTILCIFVTCTRVVADPLDCRTPAKIDAKQYDLKSLAGERTIAKTEETPPTKNRLELHFNVCEDLKIKEGVPPVDQCPDGTRACLTKTNQKEGTDDRVIVVIPVARSETSNPVFSELSSPSAGLIVQLNGPSYPPSSSPSEAQSLKLSLLCTGSQSEPKFVGYEKGVVSIEWENNAGCFLKSDGDDKKGDKDGSEDGGERSGESHGSGIGWFFLLLFIALLGYFAFGAYNNYNNFGATGWDLVPHRDFWRDVPYLLRDFGEHLCTTLRPGRQPSRRGYMAV